MTSKKKKAVVTTATKDELVGGASAPVEDVAKAEDVKVEAPTVSEAPPEPTPTDEPIPEPAELTDAEQFELLKTQLLDIYEAATPGQAIPMWHLLKETGATVERISQAWDSLYDQHKVPFDRFYKPAPGHVSIE